MYFFTRLCLFVHCFVCVWFTQVQKYAQKKKNPVRCFPSSRSEISCVQGGYTLTGKKLFIKSFQGKKSYKSFIVRWKIAANHIYNTTWWFAACTWGCAGGSRTPDAVLWLKCRLRFKDVAINFRDTHADTDTPEHRHRIHLAEGNHRW